MHLFLSSLILLAISAIVALFLTSRGRLACFVGAIGAAAASVLGLIPVAATLFFNAPDSSYICPWPIPFGSFAIQLDAISALFLLPIFLVSGLSAVYGLKYLESYVGRKAVGPVWFFYNILLVAMAITVTAHHAFLFLMAWEVMSLSSFFLVMFEAEKEEVRQAGWTYLVATHLGTAFLLAMFLLMGHQADSLDFTVLGQGLTPAMASLTFVMAVVGFGTKAGFMPFHVWLPEAHPAAPSFVSAVMSGVMIKTGIYGLVRTFTFLSGAVEPWWGWVLIGIGVTSGILGVLFALAQHDLKRLLAYHSVENIGIIALGLGLGLLGKSYGLPWLAALGFGGALLHVVNHALFKSLLFLCAGSVLHATKTRDMDHLGGLIKRMPITAGTFLVGAMAISGLPPLNGFVSEFFIYLAALKGLTTSGFSLAIAGVTVIGSLAIIGALAVACFTKAFGVVFLGEPRSDHATHAHEAKSAMFWPMVLLSIFCGVIGLGAPLVIPILSPVVAKVAGIRWPQEMVLEAASRPILIVACVSGGLLAIAAAAMGLKARLLSARPVEQTVTWDCGYAAPAASMQYTSSSFAQPITKLFRLFLGSSQKYSPPQGLFAKETSFASETPDMCAERCWGPLFRGVDWCLSGLRFLQHGHLHVYILYIAIALLVLLVWKLG